MKPANIGKLIPKVKQVGQKLPPVPIPNPNKTDHPLMQHIHSPNLRRRFMIGYMRGMMKAQKGTKGVLDL